MAKVHRLSVYRPKRSVVFASSNNCEDINTSSDESEANSEQENRLDIPVSSIYTNHNCSRNVADYLQRREHGAHVVRPISFKKEYGTRHIIEYNLLRELQISLNSYNKVFCAKWLSDTQIVLGTKCNKLLVLDLCTKKCIKLPSLKGSHKSVTQDQSNGIYSIQMNPSQTLLATGARNSNEVAVYQLPTLEPVCVGEDAHNDRIFDIIWIDDQFFVSGSRDTKIALWRVDDNMISESQKRDIPSHVSMTPLISKTCEKAEKVRALSFNQKHQVFVALSLNAYLHTWDLHTFKQITSFKLPHCLENVCLALRPDCSLYAVGSKSHLTLHDSRTLSTVNRVATHSPGCSIRSLSFENSLITMGLGNGMIMFYDCRAGKYTESALMYNSLDAFADHTNKLTNCPVVLNASSGWVYPDELYRHIFQIDYSPAILTHCYDPSGTRLFTAGGPLTSSLFGNYAGLWQ